jgi:hypothetical protein
MKTRLEHILTNAYKAEMISYMQSHSEDFEEAILLAIADRQPYSKKAAWLLWSCMDWNDHRIQGQVKRIIDVLPERSDSHVKDLLIILQRMAINEKYEARLFDICVGIWTRTEKMPSVRYNAFKVLIKIGKKHPALIKEITLLTGSQYMDSLSDTVQKALLEMMPDSGGDLLQRQ